LQNQDEHVKLADELRGRIEAGDVQGVDALYHDHAIVWRNIDNRELVKKQMLRVIEFLATQVTELRYDDVRVQATETGYVQQHTLRCIAPSGKPVEARACLVVTVEDGKVLRLDEYLDSAAMAPLVSG
jgi:ketosteroid isomerase-like protein